MLTANEVIYIESTGEKFGTYAHARAKAGRTLAIVYERRDPKNKVLTLAIRWVNGKVTETLISKSI